MRLCLLPYFDKDQFSGDLKFDKNSFENMAELKESVKLMLEGELPFRIKTDELDSDYEDSINDLIQTLYEKIGGLNLQFEFDASSKRSLSRYIKSLIMPTPLTKTEQLIQANIAGSDLITEDTRRNIKFSNLIRSIYGKSTSSLNASRQNAFNNDMLLKTIINVNNKKLITNEIELNEGIIAFQSQQYKILRDYLEDLGYNLADYEIPQNLYHTDNTTKIPVLTKGYNNLFTLMYNVINKIKKEGNFEQLLETGWTSFVFNKPELTLYRAVNAYVNLVYFDDVLEQFLGEYIQIDKNYDAPITAFKGEYGKIEFINKYTFAKGNKFATKTWGVEEHDALKEMSKFSQILIKSIPIYEYDADNNAGSESFGNMEVKDFVNTITKLLDLSSSITDFDLLEAISSFLSNPRQSILSIFDIIFKKNNKHILKELFNLGFDLNYINYLYSIYHTCFKGKNSWDSIEQFYLRNNHFPNTYPIINTILGILNSNVANNFLETTFDHDSLKVKTSIKKKYNDRSTKFDTINNVNSLTILRLNKQELLDLYKLKSSGRDYEITINIQGNSIPFYFSLLNNTGILDKPSTSTLIKISNMPDLSKIDLSSITNRRRLVENDKLSEDESKLMAILKFIDTMLSTNFSSDLDGLKRLHLMLNLYSNNFKELFVSAVRALVVTDIYNLFETASKDDGTKYSKLELFKFLEDKKPYYDAILSFNERLQKPYFIKKYDGYLLSTLYAGLDWLNYYALVEAILSGETSKSVISNLEGDKIPNFSPLFLGAIPEQLLRISNKAKDATGHLLFVQNRTAIKLKVINTDVLTKDGIRKSIKKMTTGELLYDSIVNKFFTPIRTEKIVYTQPTTYADKTKVILYGISLPALGINSLIGESFDEKIEELMKNTLGETYKGIWKNVKNDYAKLFSKEFVVDGELNLDKVLEWFNTHSATDLLNKINEYNRENKTNLVFYKDTHFREIKRNGVKCLSINELLIEYAFNLYGDKLHSRLKKEKINFLNELLANRVSFPILRDPKDSKELIPKANADSITGFLLDLLGREKAKDWIHGSHMILAKATNKNGKTRAVLYGNIEEGETITLNPALNAYFMLDTLIGNNLRMSLTGSEINHKIKNLPKLNLDTTGAELYKSLILILNPSYSEKNQVTFYDIQRALYNYETLLKYKDIQAKLNDHNTDQNVQRALQIQLEKLNLRIDSKTELDEGKLKELEALKTLYNELIYKIENAAQNAQFKRNVIIPGTMRPYTPNCIDGIGKTVKVAVINDVSASVFNFNGKSDYIDAHDGAALESPITSIMENKALLDNEVGTVKKPIHHWYDDRFGTSTLLKYAVDTITNLWMRQSEGNDLNETGHAIRLRKLFKKMHHIRWYNAQAKAEGKRGIDLIDGCDFKSRTDDPDFRSIDFFNDILLLHKLFYKKGNLDVQIINFGIENGIYYTEEQNVDILGFKVGSKVDSKVKVYHYFNDNGDHFPSSTILTDTDLHTIDSLYELHTAMGGIYSESLNSEKMLQYSEASNIVVANFVNAVAYKKDPNQSPKVTIDQSNYYQPLKEMLIDIVANNSAVKNGAGNVNSSSAYYDDSDLSYMIIGTAQYGILMDADHTADEGKMTEFSLVISSLDAGGRLHDYVSLIYETLGEVAIQLSQIELDAVEAFRNREGKSKMFDIVGRTIINNLSSDKGRAGLAETIIENIKKDFNLNTDHELDALKIPFSDPNIYSTILPTFVSIINKKSVKRQYPGLGTVMVPGYDMSMIYDLNGKTYQFEDLIQMAIKAGYQSTITDISQYNRDIVKLLLWNELKKIPATTSNEAFQPTDNVRINYTQIFNIDALDSNLVEYEIISVPWRTDPSKSNTALNIYIKGLRHLGYFLLKKDKEYEYYSVHFKTGDPDTGSTELIIDETGNPKYGSTLEQRAILYLQLYNAIPDGAKVSTYGNISTGGLKALSKLMTETIFGQPILTKVEEREVSDRNGNSMIIPVFQKIGNRNTYEESTTKVVEVSLNKIEDYYMFKNDIITFLKNRKVVNPTNITYLKNIMVPRNLAPTKISWNYTVVNPKTGLEEIHTMNIYDHWRIKNLFLEINTIEKTKGISEEKKKQLISEARKRFNPQLAFDELDLGIYIDENKTQFSISNFLNISAELIMSNLYKTKFNIHDRDSLASIIDKGEMYFLQRAKLISSTVYDMAFTKLNGDHLYLTFKPIWKNNSETFDSYLKDWSNIIRKPFEYPAETKEKDKTIINKVYATTKDNLILFEVGREILRDDVIWDSKKKKFTTTDGTVFKNLENYRRYGEDKVLEYVEFLSQHKVEEEVNGKLNKYTVYNINRSALASVLYQPVYSEALLSRTDADGKPYTITSELKFDEEVNDFISRKLLAKIYESSDFNGVLLNNTVTPASHTVIKKCLYRFGNALLYDPELSSYLSNDLLDRVENKAVEKDGIITYQKLNSIVNKYRAAIAKKQYASFLRSLNFTASRIPALTLQSFMLMHCVGFTGTATNQCFVSHWQTW